MLYLKRSIVPDKLVGDRAPTNNITDWMSNSLFADLPAAREI